MRILSQNSETLAGSWAWRRGATLCNATHRNSACIVGRRRQTFLIVGDDRTKAGEICDCVALQVKHSRNLCEAGRTTG